MVGGGGAVERGVGVALSVCVCVCGWFGGGRKRGRGKERVILKLPEQFVTLEWLLSYPGGPLIAGAFSGCGGVNGEGLGAAESGQRSWPTQAQAVRPLARAGGRRERKEAKKRGGGGGEACACQGSVFLGMLVKPAGEISV